MLIELTKSQQKALLDIINVAKFTGKDADAVVALKKALVTPKDETDSRTDS